MQRLMASMSCLPQYWLTRMVRPLINPKMMTWIKKMGALAAVTAESS